MPALDPSLLAAGDRLARRNTVVLAIAQALAGGNATVIFATSAIIGATIAPDRSLATLPVTVFVIGTALATLPTGWIARRYSRRTAFRLGTVAGMLTGLIGAAAIYIGSFALFLCATFLGGTYMAVSQSYRFAAADTASPAFRPKAISWVLAGGVFAGVLGPQIVVWTRDVWQPYLFAASYVVQAGIALIAFFVVGLVRLPHTGETRSKAAGPGRPLGEIVLDPRFLVAAICGVGSYALMNLVMTSAPLAMIGCGLTVTDAALGIQWHVLAMYGPSFVTGSLIARFGSGRIVAAGLLLIAVAAVIHLAGLSVAHFWAGLVVLGLGWNFGFVGATAQIAELAAPEERTRVQSLNDFLVFGTMAVGSAASGQLLERYGWSTVNLVVFPIVLIGLALLLAHRVAARRQRQV